MRMLQASSLVIAVILSTPMMFAAERGGPRSAAIVSLDSATVDVRLKTPCCKAIACDPMNGVSQELVITQNAEIKGVLVRDWPLVIRLFEQ